METRKDVVISVSTKLPSAIFKSLDTEPERSFGKSMIVSVYRSIVVLSAPDSVVSADGLISDSFWLPQPTIIHGNI